MELLKTFKLMVFPNYAQHCVKILQLIEDFQVSVHNLEVDGRVFVIIFKYGVGELSLDDYVSQGEECGAFSFLVWKQRRAESSNIKCKLVPSYNKFSVLDEDDDCEIDKKITDTIEKEEWIRVGSHKLKTPDKEVFTLCEFSNYCTNYVNLHTKASQSHFYIA